MTFFAHPSMSSVGTFIYLDIIIKFLVILAVFFLQSVARRNGRLHFQVGPKGRSEASF